MEENTIVEGTVVEIKKKDEHWKENDVGKRQLKMLESGYMADITIKVQDSMFRCHKNILGISSPNFAALIKEQPENLQLRDIEPNQFQFLLEIIYSGEASGLNDADNTLGVLQTSEKLHVYSAVSYCTQKLRYMIDASSACQILDFALQTKDSALIEACIKVIREETDTVLISNSFLNCSIGTLKLILCQEVVHAITELDLFLACCRWSEKYKNPREALGSALRLIRFRTFRRSDIMCNVIQTRKLLTEEEGTKILEYIICGKDDIPKHFSLKTCKRKLFLKDGELEIGLAEQIYLNENGQLTYLTCAQIKQLPPLQFSVNADLNLIGVEVWCMFASDTRIDFCMEDIDIILRNGDGQIIATATFKGEVKYASAFQIRFLRPVAIHPDQIYSLQYINNVINVLHLTWVCVKHTYKTKTNIDIRVLKHTTSVIRDLVIAPNLPKEIENENNKSTIVSGLKKCFNSS